MPIDKAANFQRLSAKRIESVLDQLRIFANLGSRIHYRYTEEEAVALLARIDAAVAEVKAAFGIEPGPADHVGDATDMVDTSDIPEAGPEFFAKARLVEPPAPADRGPGEDDPMFTADDYARACMTPGADLPPYRVWLQQQYADREAAVPAFLKRGR